MYQRFSVPLNCSHREDPLTCSHGEKALVRMRALGDMSETRHRQSGVMGLDLSCKRDHPRKGF